MEERKQKEIEYYNRYAEGWLERNKEGRRQPEFVPESLASYRFLYQILKEKCAGKEVLDYGCGNGIHSIFLAKAGAGRIVGIDLSEKSLEIARIKTQEAEVRERTEFLKMDGEQMGFADNSFDVVFDGSVFYSLDLDKAFPEIVRVLKPDGVLIGIETLGHNPLANLKRQINKLRGKRSAWAVSHIFKMPDIKKAQQYFAGSETYFFHFFSCFAFPFLSLPAGKIMLKWLERLDEALLRLAFLKKYAFKIVFVFSEPRKNNEQKVI